MSFMEGKNFLMLIQYT